MKILFINNSCSVSGAETSLLELLANLDRKRFAVIVLVPGKGELYDRLVVHHAVKILPMVRFTKSRNALKMLFFVLRWIRVSFRIARYVQKERVDLIYANNLQSHLYGVLPRLLTFKKYIWHARDNTPGYAITIALSFLSSRIICVSDSIYKQIPAKKSKKYRVYNGIDCTSWDPEKLSRGKDCENVVIGLVGQMIPWKGHLDLILAAEKLVSSYEHVKFVFIGGEPDGGSSHYQAELKRTIIAKGLSNYFYFEGFRSNMRECINGLDILVNCSGNEPFGRVIVEAMALKKVVVAYHSGGPAEIVDHMRNGILVDVHNVDTLAEQLLFLLQRKDICIDLGREARTTVIRRFSLAQTTSRIQDIIQS